MGQWTKVQNPGAAIRNSIPIGGGTFGSFKRQENVQRIAGEGIAEGEGPGAFAQTMSGILRRPSDYKRWLERKGYEVEPHPTRPGVFKFRPRERGGPWSVTNPQRGSALGDIFDEVAAHSGDLIAGGGAVVGALLGSAVGALTRKPTAVWQGRIAGAALGGAAGETFVQSLAGLAGQEEVDFDAIAATGVGSGLGEGVLTLGGAVMKHVVGPLLAESAAGMSGIKATPTVPRREVLLEIAETVPYKKLRVPGFNYREASAPVRAWFAATKDEGVFPSTVAVRQMLDAETQAGTKVNMGGLEKFLRDRAPSATAAIAEEAQRLRPVDRGRVARFLSDIERNVLAPRGETWAKMSPNTADLVRSRVRTEGIAARSYANTVEGRVIPAETDASRMFLRAYNEARAPIDEAMTQRESAGALWKELRAQQTRDISEMQNLRDVFGDSDEGIEEAARWLYNANTRESAMIKVQEAADHFGIDLKFMRAARLREAATGGPDFPFSGVPFAGFRSPAAMTATSLALLGGAGGAYTGHAGVGVLGGLAALGIVGGSSPFGAIMGAKAGLALARGATSTTGRAAIRVPALTASGVAARALAPGTEAELGNTPAEPVLPGVAREGAPARVRGRANLTGGY